MSKVKREKTKSLLTVRLNERDKVQCLVEIEVGFAGEIAFKVGFADRGGTVSVSPKGGS